MHYYVLIGGTKKGPLTFEELKESGLNADTLVWREGLSEWVKASELEDLTDLLASMPPVPPVASESSSKSPECPKTWLVESILATCLCCLPFGVVGIVYAAKVDSAYMQKEYELAAKYSRMARNWTLAAVGSMVLLIILYLLFIMFLVLLGKNSVDNSIMLSV